MSDICIFTACTENYLNRAICLYNSLNKFNKNINFYILLININKNNYFENNKNKLLTIDYENYKGISELKNYASCVRAKIFPKLIIKYKYVFWMDADTIIRKNLNELFLKLKDNDIIIYKNKNQNQESINKYGQYKTGIIGIKSNEKMINFLNNWEKLIFDNKEIKWYKDQQTITQLLKNNNYKISELEKKYIDWDFDINSPIWVGKGERKKQKIYLNEENKFLID